jgi:hypothetical protein
MNQSARDSTAGCSRGLHRRAHSERGRADVQRTHTRHDGVRARAGGALGGPRAQEQRGEGRHAVDGGRASVGGATTSVNGCVTAKGPVPRLESRARTANVKVPPAVGVPLRTPANDSVTPETLGDIVHAGACTTIRECVSRRGLANVEPVDQRGGRNVGSHPGKKGQVAGRGSRLFPAQRFGLDVEGRLFAAEWIAGSWNSSAARIESCQGCECSGRVPV